MPAARSKDNCFFMVFSFCVWCFADGMGRRRSVPLTISILENFFLFVQMLFHQCFGEFMAVLHKKLSTRSVLLPICQAFSEKKLAKIREKSFSEAEKVKRICIFWPVFGAHFRQGRPCPGGFGPKAGKCRKEKKKVPGGFFSISCTICTKMKGQLWAVPILEKQTFFFYTSVRKKVSFPAGSVLLPGFWEKESTTDECV